jgi:hypothetical protein
MNSSTFRDLAQAGYSAAINSPLGISRARNGIFIGAAIGIGLAGIAAGTEKMATLTENQPYQTFVRGVGTTSIRGIQTTAKLAGYVTSRLSTTVMISGLALIFAQRHLNELRSINTRAAGVVQFATEPVVETATRLISWATSATLAESIVANAKIPEAIASAKGKGSIQVGRAAMTAILHSTLQSASITALRGAGAGMFVEGCKKLAWRFITE